MSQMHDPPHPGEILPDMVLRTAPTLTYRHTAHMLWCMRTTVRLDEALLDRAREEASRRGVTLTSLIEQGLRLVLRRPLKRSDRPHVSLPECRAGGGVLPGVDLDDSSSLLDRMEGRS